MKYMTLYHYGMPQSFHLPLQNFLILYLSDEIQDGGTQTDIRLSVLLHPQPRQTKTTDTYNQNIKIFIVTVVSIISDHFR